MTSPTTVEVLKKARAWLFRFDDAPFPYQTWNAFPPEAIVQVKNVFGEGRIGPAGGFWWGYERNNPEGVIVKARRLDRAIALASEKEAGHVG